MMMKTSPPSKRGKPPEGELVGKGFIMAWTGSFISSSSSRLMSTASFFSVFSAFESVPLLTGLSDLAIIWVSKCSSEVV